MTEVLQGPQEVDEGGVRGRIRCISTQLENEVSHVETFNLVLLVMNRSYSYVVSDVIYYNR